MVYRNYDTYEEALAGMKAWEGKNITLFKEAQCAAYNLKSRVVETPKVEKMVVVEKAVKIEEPLKVETPKVIKAVTPKKVSIVEKILKKIVKGKRK